MTFDQSVQEAVARSNLSSKGLPKNWADIVVAAAQFVPNYSERVVEVSATGIYKMPDGASLGTEEAHLFLFPSHFVLTRMKGLFSKRVDVQGSIYGDEIKGIAQDTRDYSDGKVGSFDIQFFGAGRVPLSRLGWEWWKNPKAKLAAATERDRIFRAFNDRGLT